MFARGPQTAAQLSKLFQLNKVKKSYLAIVDAKNMLPEHKVIKDRGSGETIEKMMTKTATGPRLGKFQFPSLSMYSSLLHVH